MIVHLDYETYASQDLKKNKVYRYAMAHDTDILCAAVKIDRGPVRLWSPLFSCDEIRAMGLIPITLDELIDILKRADIVAAHNAQFERLITKFVGTRLYGLPIIPIEKWRCTAVRARVLAMPARLGNLAAALKLCNQKDEVGNGVMLRFCKPTKATKKKPSVRPDLSTCPDEAKKIFDYCCTDVLVEEEIDDTLPQITGREWDIYAMDQRMNDRGIAVDVDGVRELLRQIEEEKVLLLAEVAEMTGGKFVSPTQIDKCIDWLEGQGCDMDSLNKNSVSDALLTAEGPAKRMLEIRQIMGKGSVGKFETLLAMVSPDGRIRGTQLFHGAGPGRWTGIGFQPHNLPRESFKTDEEVEQVILGFMPGSSIKNASKCIRGVLFIECDIDLSAIQGRVAAWLAGEEHVLEAYRDGKDLYLVAASGIYKVPYESLNSESPERQIGKVAELASGFQGWTSAYYTMAESYPKVKTEIHKWGFNPTMEEAVEYIEATRRWSDYCRLTRAQKEQIEKPPSDPGTEEVWLREKRTAKIILAWRDSRPATCAAWKAINAAAIEAVQNPNTVIHWSFISFLCEKVSGIDYLYMRLPNGKRITYPFPEIIERTDKYKRTKPTLTFMSEFKGQWMRVATYGGSLFENAVMGIEREIVAGAMMHLEEIGQEPELTVHDSIALAPSAGVELKTLVDIIVQVPTWAPGLPIAAKGWFGKRYKKD